MRFAHHLVAAAMILAMTIGLIIAARSDAPALPDESEWITAGYRTFELVSSGAGSDDWESAYVGLSAWGNQNPPVGKLIIGASIALVHADGDRVRFITTFPFDLAANTAAGNIPPAEYLAAARTAIAVLAGVCLALAYIAAVLLLRRRWLPLVTPLSLCASQVFVHQATHVFTDIPQFAFVLAAFVSLQLLVGSRREWLFPIAAVLAGLACATKFSAAPLVAAAMVFVALRREVMRRRVIRVLVLAVVPFAVFVAVNPYLYSSPVHRSMNLVRRWSAYVAAQQRDPALAANALMTPVDRIEKVTTRAVVAPRIATWVPPPAIAGAVLALVASALAVRRRLRRLAWIGGGALVGIALSLIVDSHHIGVLAPLLVAAGIAHLVRTRRDEQTMLFALIAGAFLAFTMLWIPFDWTRYYLPVIVWMPLVHAAGAAHLVALATRDDERSMSG